MQVLSENGIVDLNWQLVEADVAKPEPDTIVPLASWLSAHEDAGTTVSSGVWLRGEDDPDELSPHCDRLPIVALHFAAFADGRSLSSAHLLRTRHGYKGDLLAIGDVRRDQVEQMYRCGINLFRLADGQDLHAASESFKLFTYSYQSSADRPMPLFRQRPR